MRTLWGLLLSVLILASQTHACRAVFLCLDGDVCATCPTHVCQDDAVDHAADQSLDDCTDAADQNDCTECCSISPCLEDEPAKSKETLPVGVVFALIAERAVAPSAPVRFQTSPILGKTVAFLPHAPPGSKSARAPPFFFV